MSDDGYNWDQIKPPTVFFDYKLQAWVDEGKYVRCGHPDKVQCGCYGRLHEGERATFDPEHCH